MDPKAIEPRLLHRGAEADLFLSKLGSWDVVVKQRVRKDYRNPVLDDRIRRERTAREATALHEAKKAGVRAPSVLAVDLDRHSITMTRVVGLLARDNLDKMSPETSTRVLQELGRQIGLLHMEGIVHGDLTTSNIIISEGDIPFTLDFGMSSRSFETEDRGVDLHLLKRSIATSHTVNPDHCAKAVLRGYRVSAGLREAGLSFRKAAEIARRGRYFAIR